ncbi:DUF3263 domain-containing protein [Corynebacterium pseudotuberculosis]|uniref:DUF3263 domain-containing protein n=2 Tax=Corynebacterium pseudotuberculosis TaxID=1719 RepID=D9QCJ3_CORP2|nr:DUF3263 domain-containing protein [Corynebacterium pseudotuberculosis]AER69830.1 Transcriptional regulator, Fis family [Corynebacterium pseudotuberculosis 1/06-A]ADK29612.1 DUF3263 domain-containing protein [Corynebacterium pseudotuberculosis FRC41]ADL11269.1 DUF3263 domain-containing protein [Corynebacterium pseudotuberculosis C231]ADL21685.2 DUF3263 domain-containing protein [Corynebacterium pseudotuberculosis 1002]ADO27080.2 DUF3263 domain-containing protein [Corynebacterium pseudotuberc
MPYSVGMSDANNLTRLEKQLALLAFEERAPHSLGAKEEAIREELGISPVRYFQSLNRAIDVPEVMSEYPVLTARLRRIRDQRADRRAQAQKR